MTDTNRAEPMKGLAEWLREIAAIKKRTLINEDRAEARKLDRWAAEVEASRLPLAGAATSDERLEQLIEQSDGHWKEDVFCIGAAELMALLRKAGASSAPSGAAVQHPVALPFAILADEMAALQRFHETCEDSQPYDVPKPMMQRLAEIGLVRRTTAAIYEFTNFGLSVVNGDFATSPLPTAPAGAREAHVKRILDLAMEHGRNEYHRAIAKRAPSDHEPVLNELARAVDAALAAAPGARQPLSDEVLHILREADEIIAGMADWFRNQPLGAPPVGTAELQYRLRKLLESEHGITLAPIAGKGDGNGNG